MATLDWDGLVFYDQQIKKHIENKLVNEAISKDELDKILDKYASKTYVSDEIAKIDLTIYAKTSDVDTKLANYVKKTDAFSGSYNDLTDKPTIPNVSNLAAKADLTAHTSDNSIHITSAERTKWNAKLDNTALNGYATETYVANEVAKVSTGGVDLTGYAKTADVDTKLTNYVKKTDAFSGSYNDLTDKPVIPNITGKADKTYVDTELAKKANKSELFSGSYNDLTDKPTIPDITNLATKTELNNHVGSTKHITDDERTKWNGYNDTINTMKTNFEDGVNTIYNAVVAKGITPSDKRPSSIVNAIERLILMISKGPLVTYTFETGSPMMPVLNGKSSYINFCKDTDNGDGTTTRKLYVETEVNKINFGKETGTSSIISLDNTASIKLTSTNRMFKNCVKLRSVNLSNLDTSNVTNIDSMFFGCRSLTSLDLSNFDTSKVTSMQETFRLCTSLTSLDVSNFNTSKVTSIQGIFNFCESLNSLDVSNFDTSQVTDMSRIFAGCKSLTSLDVSNFNTSQVTDMRLMFSKCSGLTSLNLSNFNMSKVENMENMFNECTSLTSLDLSNFNTPQAYAIDYMFCNCTSLTSLDLSNFSTENVEYSHSMFYGCTSLTSLDIRNFSSASLIQYDNMFSSIPSTCKIYADKTKFTKTETECGFAGTFTNVS